MYIPRRKQKYYIPGIISLTILPFIFCFYAKREIQQSAIWGIRLLWVDTAHLNKLAALYKNPKVKYPPERKYTDIILTGNNSDDRTKLDFSQIRVKEILKVGDTLNGIHFIFTNSSAYGTLVGAVDRLRIEGAQYYLMAENDIWFWHVRTDTAKAPNSEYLLCDDLVYVESKISWWIKAKADINHIWNTSWQLIILYITFVISMLVLQRKNNRNKQHFSAMPEEGF